MLKPDYTSKFKKDYSRAIKRNYDISLLDAAIVMKITIPDNVQAILSVLESAGYEAFIVGGCVRDGIRGVKPTDWDVATSATPGEVRALFSRTVDTGIKHGTITVLIGGDCCEVTTYRLDGEYLDGRRPESVTFARRIEDDLSRRDFTMNAIAYNSQRGFVDPFGGREDIEKKLIRCVGEAQSRFGEDALRMLRAVRFSSMLGFSVDAVALEAITKLKKNLALISAERIREELGKLLTGAEPQAAKLLETTGLLPYVLMGREYGGNLSDVLTKIQACPTDEPMRLTLFLEWAGADCESILKDLRFDNKTIKEVAQYIRLLREPLPHDRYDLKKLLRQLTQEYFEKLLNLKIIAGAESQDVNFVRREAQDIITNGECYTLRGLAVNGDDLAQIGIPRGKTMGDTLEFLLDTVMRDPLLNQKPLLLSLIKEKTNEI
ncbi:MAG: CCA tRNA nucleotidyltransferase [Defluviitaleaceae bacterium]|nr:CCA tRNA nucleotidyltransferase [Defluviitaleaceae bacterium]